MYVTRLFPVSSLSICVNLYYDLTSKLQFVEAEITMDTPTKKRNIAGESPKLVFTFEFEKNNFSAIEKPASSDKCKIGGLSWRLIIDKNVNEDSNEEIMTIYLLCEGKSELWCCYARVDFTILSQKEGVPDFRRKLESLYSALKDNWGLDFMRWDEIVDPEKGYIKNDTVKIRVHIVADAPQNTAVDYKKERPQSFDEWLTTLENEINDKLVRRMSEELKETNGLIREEFKGINISKETWKKIIDSAIEPICTRIDLLEKNRKDFEKSCQDYLRKIVDWLESAKMKKTEEKGNENKENENGDKKRKNSNGESDVMKKPKMLCAGNEIRDVCAEHQHQQIRIQSLYPVGASAYRYNELYSPHIPHIELKPPACSSLPYVGFYPPLGSQIMGLPSRNLPDCSIEKTCRSQVKGENASPAANTSSNDDQNEIPSNEKRVAKDEKTENDFGVTPINSSKLKLFKPNIPPEEEFDENEDLTKPMEKKLLLIGKDGGGDVTTHNVTSLKELFELKKKYDSSEVLEVSNND